LKIGITAWSLPQTLTIPQGFRVAKGTGFDAVELDISENGYLPLDMSNEEVKAFRTAAENMSLELRSVSVRLLWIYQLTSDDPHVVANAKSIIRRGLEISRILGADTLLVVPGSVSAEVPYDVACERAQSALKELAFDAESENVSIAIENAWNKMLMSPLELRDFIDSIESDYVGSYFDVGNVMAFGYPEQWIRILGKRIKKVHAKDFKTAIGNADGFANLLQGDVDWIAVRNALRDVGYDDTVTAEVPGFNRFPDLGMRQSGDILRRIFRGG
jgi:hexulose-6-phosphate isomerase